MCHLAPDTDYSLHAELLIVDGLAEQVISKIDPSVVAGFTVVHGIPTAINTHITILIGSNAEQLDALAMRLTGQRLFAFAILLGNPARERPSGPYIACPSHRQYLIPMLTAIRRLFLEHSAIGVDWADVAPLFRTAGPIGFVHRTVSQGTGIAQAANEIGQLIRAGGALPFSIVVVLACGRNRIDDGCFLQRIDAARDAITAPPSDDLPKEIVVTAYYMRETSDEFLISVFYAGDIERQKSTD